MTQPMQLYSLATPNGRKVSIALEEMGLIYEAHTIDIRNGEQKTEEFLAMNPNGKIPVLVDPEGDNGQPLTIMESGAILIYLAEKTGQFLPPASEPTTRSNVLQWLFFQVGHVGPMFGQFGHFYAHEGKDKCDHPYPLERFEGEVTRILGILDAQLEKQEYLAGEYSIADMATFPWVGCLDWGYSAKEYLKLENYPNVMEWHERCSERPAAKRGAQVCPFPGA